MSQKVDYDQVKKLKATNPPCEACPDEPKAEGYFLDTDGTYHPVGRKCWEKYNKEIGKAFDAGAIW